MPDLKLRPRFDVCVRCDANDVADALRDHIGTTAPPLEGSLDPAHCVLRIPESRRSLWSPELDLTFEPLAPGEGDGRGLRVRCLFAPRPPVWTSFAFVYAMLSAVVVAGAMYALAQLTLGHPPWAAGVAGGALLLIGGIYAATYIGQGLSAAQMYELRRFLDTSLEEAERRARLAPKAPLDSARL